MPDMERANCAFGERLDQHGISAGMVFGPDNEATAKAVCNSARTHVDLPGRSRRTRRLNLPRLG
jgi:hypothetical protein